MEYLENKNSTASTKFSEKFAGPEISISINNRSEDILKNFYGKQRVEINPGISSGIDFNFMYFFFFIG